MIKSSFLALKKPVFRYSSPNFSIINIPVPDRVTLCVNNSEDNADSCNIKIGDSVKTGQKITPYKDSDIYVISTITGSISDIRYITGDFGKKFMAITINKENQDQWDNQLQETKFDLETAINYLGCIPGNPCFNVFGKDETNIETIIINGLEQDLLVTSNQHHIYENTKYLKAGVTFLKRIIGVLRVIIAVPERMLSVVNSCGAEVFVISDEYPYALNQFLMKNILSIELAPGEIPESNGVTFMTGEAVSSLGYAIENKQIPIDKMVTVINKDHEPVNVKVRIGTHLQSIFNKLKIETKKGDRVIIGGPLRGSATYSELMPVLQDTDAILIQDASSLSLNSDYPCINCGECVRICPANIPINELVRFLENAKYEEAAQQYDLLSCVECGLCTIVCPSKMPIFQFIKLGKYELEQIPEAEDES